MQRFAVKAGAQHEQTNAIMKSFFLTNNREIGPHVLQYLESVGFHYALVFVDAVMVI